jgi:UDP-2,3-diacylglucosamine pyrophosphatase LpxH
VLIDQHHLRADVFILTGGTPMKIFLSDLHFSDGKERDDFQYHKEFDELVKSSSEEFRTIEIILLGDIFDLIRTQKYCEFEGSSLSDEKIREVKRNVMAEILENHGSFFETLRHFAEQPGHTFKYVVGNHDFGASLDSTLPEMIREKFGLLLTPEHYYRNEPLGIWEEHGHRYDIINNTYNKDGVPITYCLGDRIVVEIVDRFLEKVREEQAEIGVDPAVINDLDNVRPQSAIGNWLDSIDEGGRLNQIYNGTIATFLFNNPGEVATLAMNIFSGKYQPDLLKAARDLTQKGVGRHIIFGHTHDPLDEDFPDGAKHLNAGTWRKFIEPKGRPSTRRRTVPTYKEGDTQFYTQEPYFYYKFKSITNLSYILFYEVGEGETGPGLIRQEKASAEG